MALIADTTDFRRKSLLLIEHLKPFPGRLRLALSIGAICAVSTVISMMYHFPEAAIGCYLVIFLMKPNAAENVMTGAGIIIAVSGVVFVLIGLIVLTIDFPPAQFAAIAIASFLFLYLDSASKAGEQAGIVALVISFVLTLMGQIPVGEVATRAVLYAWAMVFVPMAVMALYNLLFGISPQWLLRQRIAERLNIAADCLEGENPKARDKLMEALGEGTAESEKQLRFIAMFKILYGSAYDFLERSQAHSYRLLLAVSAMENFDGSENRRKALTEACRAIAIAVVRKEPLPALDGQMIEANEGSSAVGLDRVSACLEDLSAVAAVEKGAPVADPFIASDIFTNPVHLHFALKTTLAALTCYFIYSAIDWQGIHTAMITCYVAALGTTGDTVHKLVLRITGCLIGAFFGFLAVLFVVPHLESAGGLAILIFVVVSLAAWISTGSERISYGGVQIALAFLLTVLQGFSPGTSLSAAGDRIVGILLGNFVVYIIFTNIWPVSISYEVGARMRIAVAKLKALSGFGFDTRRASTALLASVEADLGEIRSSVEMAGYEPRGLRPSRNERQNYLAGAGALHTLALDLYFKPEIDVPISQRLDNFERRFESDDEAAGGGPPAVAENIPERAYDK